MPEKPQNIGEVINLISKSDFNFSKLESEYFAPAPDEQGENGGAAFVVAGIRERGKWKKRIKITQLRKLFAEVKCLERELKIKRLWEEKEEILPEDFYTGLWLLHPELAYARGRNLIDEDFFKLMRRSIQPEKLKSVGDFRRFSEFLTAVLAYSKYLPD